jgi:hypothetical protein
MKTSRTDPVRPDRRALMASALLAVAGGLPLIGLLNRRDPMTVIRELLPRDLRAARALGELYLETQPGERSASWLTRELFGSGLTVDRPRLDLLKRRIRDSRARDFRRGDLVLLHGWLLPRTEARLLALCAVVPAP